MSHEHCCHLGPADLPMELRECTRQPVWYIVPEGARYKFDTFTTSCAFHAEEMGMFEGEARPISEGTAWLTDVSQFADEMAAAEERGRRR